MQNEHKFYMDLAIRISQQSYCERSKVGAILVKDHNIISFGYNGTPAGFDNVCEIGDLTKDEVLHAEANAIIKCARSSHNSEGSVLYVTLSPCLECAKLIIQSGILKIYYLEEYRDLKGLILLDKSVINSYQI